MRSSLPRAVPEPTVLYGFSFPQRAPQTLIFSVTGMSAQLRTHLPAHLPAPIQTSPGLCSAGPWSSVKFPPRQTWHPNLFRAPTPQLPETPSTHIGKLFRVTTSQGEGRGQPARRCVPATGVTPHSKHCHSGGRQGTCLPSTGRGVHHLFKYILSIYCMPGTALGPGGTTVTSTDTPHPAEGQAISLAQKKPHKF